MPNFSKSPQTLLNANIARSYVGLRVMQGVPLLDRDLNLCGDLIAATLRRVLRTHIGDGTGEDGAEQFKIAPTDPPSNDFTITAGGVLAGGIVTKTGGIAYSSQGLAALNPAGPTERADRVYLDIWLAEIDGSQDPHLFNADDYELETSVRIAPRWAVRVVESDSIPAPVQGHVHVPLAVILRPKGTSNIEAFMIQDNRATSLHLPGTITRVGAAEALSTDLRRALEPAFADNPFSHAYGYPEMCLTIRGRHLDIGGAEVHFYTAGAGDQAPRFKAPLLGEPSASSLTVRIPHGITGLCEIAITAGLGQIVAPVPFKVYGPPRFAAKGPHIAPREQVAAGDAVTLYGEFFDSPDMVVDLRHAVYSSLYPATIIGGTATSTSIKIVAPDLRGPYFVRIHTPASDKPAISQETLHIGGIDP